MIYGENQVRQFYVLDDNHGATPVIAFDKFYVKYDGPAYFGSASSDTATITTDKINKGCIRDIRISRPNGGDETSFIIELNPIVAASLSSFVGEDFELHFNFSNWAGFGKDDIFQKFAVLHLTAANTASLDDFYRALFAAIKNQFNNKTTYESPFDLDASESATETLITASTPKVKLIERKLKAGSMDPMLGLYDQGITCNIYTSEENVAGSDQPWGTVTKNTVEYKYSNGRVIADMEYFFLRGRADLYGLNGFPNVNPSMTVANVNKEYYVLDIHYYTQEWGVNNQFSEKTMSFAAENISVLEAIIDGTVKIADVSSAMPAVKYNAFDTSTDYKAGDMVEESGNYYVFNVDHPKGAWTGSDVTDVTNRITNLYPIKF